MRTALAHSAEIALVARGGMGHALVDPASVSHRRRARRASRCPSRSLAWAGGRLSPFRSFLLRRRTDRRHRTRAPTRPLRAASRAFPGPLPFEDRLGARRVVEAPDQEEAP